MILRAEEEHSDTAPREPTPTARPFCFWCGYDLFGLELPRPCPECGHVSDPVRDQKEARRWFASPRSWFGWLFRPSKTPPGLWYVLDDTGSARVARRRCFRWLWLPVVLTSLMVVSGVFFGVEYDVKIWYYKQSDPKRTPLRVVHEKDTDRLFYFNLHFFRGGIFYSKPASWERVIERQNQRFVMTRYPADKDVWELLLCGALPWSALLCGYLPSRWCLSWLSRRTLSSHRRHRLRRTIVTASSVAVPTFCATLWAWLGVGAVSCLATVSLSNEDLLDQGNFIMPAIPIAGWALASVTAWPVLVTRDRARRILPHRFIACLTLVGIAAGGPVAAIWLLGILLG